MSRKDTADSPVDFTVDSDATKDARGKKAAPSGVMKKILIHPKGPEDSPFQAVGVNGKVWQIRKGVEVEVPEFVLHVLQNAVETHFIEGKSEKDDIIYNDRFSPRFTVEVRA